MKKQYDFSKGVRGTPINLHKYRCSKCKKTVLRIIDQQWFSSYCESTGTMGRMMRVRDG